MTIKKLALSPYAQAHVEIDEAGNIYLFSHRTLVCSLSKDGWLTCSACFTASIRRHIGYFMREYVKYPDGNRGSYYDAKMCHVNGYRLNIQTGEVEDL